MADTEKNALSDLSDRLKMRIAHHGYAYHSDRQDDITVQRIIAELSNVRDYEETESLARYGLYLARVIGNCRMFADEGVAVKDEKPTVAGRTKRKASKMCFCEQCGAMITKEDYDNFGCVCASCAIENL